MLKRITNRRHRVYSLSERLNRDMAKLMYLGFVFFAAFFLMMVFSSQDVDPIIWFIFFPLAAIILYSLYSKNKRLKDENENNHSFCQHTGTITNQFAEYDEEGRVTDDPKYKFVIELDDGRTIKSAEYDEYVLDMIDDRQVEVSYNEVKRIGYIKELYLIEKTHKPDRPIVRAGFWAFLGMAFAFFILAMKFGK